MASSVYFKFKSQKEPTRVEFDGTGISVFELKREIIQRSGLGDGTEFDLAIYADEALKEVYDDDTTIIPRSSTVIARRMAPRPGQKGSAARYVSGKMPAHARNSSRREQMAKLAAAVAPVPVQLSSNMTEEEKLGAIFQAQTSNWKAVEQDLTHQQFIPKSGTKKPVNVPDHEPPSGYICYRCGEKGHWIQVCPTNDDPDFDNRRRVKRTTGIPRSFLKTVNKETALAQNAEGEDKPAGLMVNADGEFVIAEPDKASWERFQAKTKSNAAAHKNPSDKEKEVQEAGLECPMDKKMFIEPIKTPCCEKTYCNDCITNALIESDFVCPGCQQEGVLIDDLIPDEASVEKIKEFLSAKDPIAKSPQHPAGLLAKANDDTIDKPDSTKARSPSPAPSSTADAKSYDKSLAVASATNGESSGTQNLKKRPAEETLPKPRIPKAPKAMQRAQEEQQKSMMMRGMPSMGMNGMGGMGMNGMPPMPFINGISSANYMDMNMMAMMMGNTMVGNPMMAGFSNMNGGMNVGMNGMGPGFNQGPVMGGNMSRMNGGYPNNMNGGNGDWNDNAGHGGMNLGMGRGGNLNGNFHNMNGNMSGNMNSMNAGGLPYKTFSHQPADEEDAYFRKPVNPHRHQNRQRRNRPSDYTEL